MKIGFFWTPQLAASVLQDCINTPHIEVCFVVTQEDKPVGRKMILTSPPVKTLAQQYQIPVLQPKTMRNDIDLCAELKKYEVDYFIVVAYGKIFPKEILEIPKKNCLNIHTSLLPFYRGSSPIQSALLCGEKQTGVTIMLMDEKMDEGDILSTWEIPLSPQHTAQDVFSIMAKIAGKQLIETLDWWDRWIITPLPQEHHKATYCRKISKQDGQVFFTQESAQIIFQKWQAFYPWPGIFSFFEEKRILFLQCILEDKENNHEAGEVFVKNEALQYLYIQTPNGAIGVSLLQIEGKKPMNIAEFLCGYKYIIGYQF